MVIGAVMAGASEAECGTVERMAAAIGLAFQIQDDILDVFYLVVGRDDHQGSVHIGMCIFCRGKDRKSRAQRKDENEVFDLNAAEAHPVLPQKTT